jgi:outer membrane protein assembly factor BamB
VSFKSTRNVLCGALLALNFGYAQYGRGGGDWLAEGGDAQRSNWVKNDPHISVESVQGGVMQLLWKLKLNGSPTAPVVASRLITYKGFKDLLFASTSADNVVSIDHVMGKVFWESHLPYDSLLVPVKNGNPNCPAGMTAALSLTGPAPPRAPSTGTVAAAPIPTLPRPKRVPAVVYALSSDGLIHTLNQHTGTDIGPAYRFLRGNAKARDLISVGNSIYAVTSDHCGGAPNGVWSINMEDTLVSEWKTGDASVLGLAFAAQDTVYATTTEGIAALDAKTLKVKQHRDGSYATTPFVFSFKDKEYVTAGNVSGHILMLDPASLELVVNVPGGGAKLARSFASWEDADKVRWILAAKNGAIVAFKLMDEGGTLSLKQAWTSRDLVSPAAPIVVNGVVFALSSGSASTPAVLYALDGSTGKELWNSGKAIATYATAGISGGASKIYVPTVDGTLYAFGYALNRE